MNISEELNKIEDQYADTLDEQREEAVEVIRALQDKLTEESPEDIDRFLLFSADTLGGIYLPYVFWYKLGEFYEGNAEARLFLQELIRIFSESSFEEAEQKKIKSLLVAYLAREREFEIDKIRTLIVDKAHPAVKDYFYKLFQFVQKNKNATTMYCDKFEILKEYQPNFELLSLPLSRLREILQ